MAHSQQEETTTEEGWHMLEDGTRLYTKIWRPSGPIKARLIFIHGYSDHCNIHYALFPTLASRGIEGIGFDQRGWGRSFTTKNLKGSTGPTSQVLADITSVVSKQLSASPPAPMFLMGHSMGGAELLTYLAQGPKDIRRQIRGFIVEAPFIAVHPSSAPSRLTVMVGRLAAKVVPRFQLVQHLDPKWVCRDPQVGRDILADDLCHDTGTLEGLAGMLDRAADLETGKLKIEDDREAVGEGHPLRVLFAQGSEDRVTSCDASQAYFKHHLNIEDKEFKVYEGWYHKLHAEPGEDKYKFVNDVADWILARASPQGDEGRVEGKPRL